ncbi:6-phosphogluconate dehydrogenase, NAD(+)-dependent, decarboxylating [Roseovarius albus]|uniref:6-phosphogluconate dehydrogenase, decarboxylating n=1 Tax=Roseovarius albus TaxID=1247867 RepID=A0A1X6YL02_9RHOB|nr:NADP-dependent phosphogluconate dehydrogenase [Roseovarius albus]SLN24618.1 6-phosphogluconate dehydrogenase, NAD(+)-dependent, decarboxylating [Roseovarius albus]
MTQAQIGVYGLGTMGSALALNMAGHGFEVAVTNREIDWIAPFIADAGDLAARLHPHNKLADFVADLKTPRVILFMIPSGAPMDMMIDQITPLLESGDTIIDGGNANFHDTRRRSKTLKDKDIHFVGMGVSGGEKGARHGPSMMVGGTEHSWHQLRPILRAIAATYQDNPCVDHLGPDGAGHFVKTVHNGVEYADMQVIAELYGLLRYGSAWPPSDIGKLFEEWDKGPLKSYLVEITGKVLQYTDPFSGHAVVDVIKDAAGQKGTGRWTVVEAVRMGQSTNMIEAAVGARAWSAEKETRQEMQNHFGGARDWFTVDPGVLADAFLAARILCYAQGFRILDAASKEYDWALDMGRIAEIWRAGCIIRSALLDDISEAFADQPPHSQLILSPKFTETLARTIPALRTVVSAAVTGGHAIPALSSALNWFDTMRQGFGTANIIQAQRDFFGYHGFERLGEDGQHHGPWWD